MAPHDDAVCQSRHVGMPPGACSTDCARGCSCKCHKEAVAAPIGPKGFNLIRLRYHIKGLPERIPRGDRDLNAENPCGVALTRPWPTARVLFADEGGDGYLYVWWIDTPLTKQPEGIKIL